MFHVVIVGAGLSGLSIAYRLRCAAPMLKITILEKENQIGGNIRTVERAGFRVETGPNGFLDAKPSTVQLCQDLGLQQHLLAASEGSRKNRYLFWNGRLRKLPSSFWSFVTNDILSWRGKLGLYFEKYRRGRQNIDEDESIYDFARRRAGREVAAILADAMVTGIHGGDARLLSVRAAFPRLVGFEQNYGSVMRGFTAAARERRQASNARGEKAQPVRMWSFREGLGRLIAGLKEHCQADVVTGVKVRSIRRDDRWTVSGEGADRWQADSVVLTSQGPEQASQLAEIDAPLAEIIASIAYATITVVALGFLRRHVPKLYDGFGYIAPQALKRDILGVQWCSEIFPDRAPEGCLLYRSLCGGWHRPDIISWDEERLIRAVRDELHLAQGITDPPVFTEIKKWPNAIPQYTLGHLQKVAQIEKRLSDHPGLFLGGNLYHGVAMNDCTERATIVANSILDYLRTQSPRHEFLRQG